MSERAHALERSCESLITSWCNIKMRLSNCCTFFEHVKSFTDLKTKLQYTLTVSPSLFLSPVSACQTINGFQVRFYIVH